MARLISIAAAASLVFTLPAYAQTFKTVPGIYTFSGEVYIKKGSGINLSCTMTMDIVNNGSWYEADNVAFTDVNGICDRMFVPANMPWNVYSSINVVFDYVYVSTPFQTGDCTGSIYADYALISSEELHIETGFFSPSTLPEVVSGTGDCKIEGIISW
jgi:hypothetical protein